MRIISGSRRGRKIDPPQGLTARPTTDFAKEGLFNVLANRVEMESLDVLDLFGGTGSIGYEFVCEDAVRLRRWRRTACMPLSSEK